MIDIDIEKYICSPSRECPLPTGQFQLFLSCGFVIIKKPLVNMVNLVRMQGIMPKEEAGSSVCL